MTSLNKIKNIYKNIKNNFLTWLGVNPPKIYDNNIIEVKEILDMNKSEKDILTEIVIDNHEEEFRIKETGDDGGSHFALYVPVNSDTSTIEKEMSLVELEKIKARKTSEKAALQKEIAEIGKMITQIKKV